MHSRPASRFAVGLLLGLLPLAPLRPQEPAAVAIPLPEHPRPDFERQDWLNLNGSWSFRFDREDQGEKEGWPKADLKSFPAAIVVPFSWGSKLSGLGNEADIGWYARTVRAPEGWKGKRVFLRLGACDWRTSGWLDGEPLGEHRGGYTPFEFELTPRLVPGRDHLLVLRADDTPHPFKLEGKQGYGQARGIWQTAYLEARPDLYLESVQMSPDVDGKRVRVRARLSGPAPENLRFRLASRSEALETEVPVERGGREVRFDQPIPAPRLWSPEDPFLYQVELALGSGESQDRVRTYFGMRKIGLKRLPGTDYPYIALNDRPFYFQMALDQSYHPDGFYTFPSDEFMRDEVLRSLRIGLNAIRIHVKVEVPRKLYWADRLGLLVMADVPNSWGEPDQEMRAESETALRGMVERDFNHPSIFSWVLFNETWGLKSKEGGYTPQTQEWVLSMVRLARGLDSTRLVEDNSPCNLDHVQTDLNTWHAYLPGYGWRAELDRITRETHPGSRWNYIGGREQKEEPLMNSECGNVWGYEGSTGDVDWSWDYHIMMNEFRRHPKVCGWLYTEHHDVINEWNGYYRFDRSPKITGLSELVSGMSLRDLHGPFYLAPGLDPCEEVKPGAKVLVPLWGSFLTDRRPEGGLVLQAELSGWDGLGRRETSWQSRKPVEFTPWMSKELPPLEVVLPSHRGLMVLSLVLQDQTGTVLHRNFTSFLVTDGPAPRDETVQAGEERIRVIRLAPAGFAHAEWSLGHWSVLDGLKVDGAGSGFFEYRLPWPKGLEADSVASAGFRAELSAKELFSKDRAAAGKQEGDFMRGKGTADPSLNPNSYPMTDTRRFPSAVRVRFAGRSLGLFQLADDPADHRGILSWHSQKRDRKLREAGSYGYLVQAAIPEEALRAAAAKGEIVLRLEVDPALAGGLAVYGERFGRYPLDPTLTFVFRGKR